MLALSQSENREGKEVNITSAKEIKENVRILQQCWNRLGHGPLDWYIIRLVEALEEFVRRCSRFQPGDRIELVRPVDPDENSGWYTHRGCLIPGNPGTVIDVSYNSTTNRFDCYVRFDRESWINDAGEEISSMDADKHHLFILCESILMPIRCVTKELSK